jgi:hypothetical protein
MPSLRPCPAFACTPTRDRPQRTTGQEVPEADQCGPVSRIATGKPAASPRLQLTLIHLRERFPQISRLTMRRLSRNSSRPPRRPLAPAPTKMTAVGPAPTSLGSMTRGLYVASSTFATTSSTAAIPTTLATSSRGHDAGGRGCARRRHATVGRSPHHPLLRI